MKTLIRNGIIVNEGRLFSGSIVVDGDTITDIFENAPSNGAAYTESYDEVIDAEGCYVLPGVIDDHVHFREPGLTAKADIESESRAAAFGGVTSYFDMPNTVPQTTTLEALNHKRQLAADKSHVNYAFFFGATNDNAHLFPQLDIHRTPGIKLFMGSSTGNMLVDQQEALDRIFATAPMIIMAHCEDTDTINRNMAEAKATHGNDPDIALHPQIRSEEACYRSTALAVAMARKHNARLHVAHVTTARELELFEAGADNITAEAVVAHLLFADNDYQTLGARIKCNPAVKTAADRDALRQALTAGRIAVVGTDHAPHLLAEKQGGAASATSGMPMLQFSLVAMLELVDLGVLTIDRVVQLMCHRPAELFEVRRRGFLRKGYKADIAIVRRGQPWTITADCLQSRCQWSPLEGRELRWRVEHTVCNGLHIYNKGVFLPDSRGEELLFR